MTSRDAAARRRARKRKEARRPAPPPMLITIGEEDDGCPVCVAARSGDPAAFAAAWAEAESFDPDDPAGWAPLYG